MQSLSWQRMRKSDAEKYFKLIFRDNEDYAVSTDDWSSEYISLRNVLVNKYNEIASVKNEQYYIDLNFGLFLYETMGRTYRFTIADASANAIWWDLGIRVLPDIVKRRLSIQKGDISERNVYAVTTKIWLRRIWWYIHLSWQGDYQKTKTILDKNTTDTIMWLVDHIGLNGYRIDLFRKIMAKYDDFSNKNNINGTDRSRLFRYIMIKNSALTLTIDPFLADGGLDGYVNSLFSTQTPQEKAQ